MLARGPSASVHRPDIRPQPRRRERQPSLACHPGGVHIRLLALLTGSNFKGKSRELNRFRRPDAVSLELLDLPRFPCTRYDPNVVRASVDAPAGFRTGQAFAAMDF